MKTSTQIVIAVVSVAVVVTAAVGTYFIVKNISEENHKKDIEMAADCAQTFERPIVGNITGSGYVSTGAYEKYVNSRNTKRQECAEKYHVTHQEIIDKIGTEDYDPR